MRSRDELEALFLAHLSGVERILSALSRRHGLSPDAAEEFAAWAKLKLIENDYAILAKFRGESSLMTYLTVVLAMAFRGYRVAQWGRWRPSAAARRGGDVAIRLEALIRRDRVPLAQAGQVLRASGATTLTDRELAELASRFPERLSFRVAEKVDTSDLPAPTGANDLVEDAEAAAQAATVRRELSSALDRLDDEERLIVRLHYMEAMSVADIARGLSVPQKPLYRRLERALGRLRVRLERAGVSSEHIHAAGIGE